MLKHRQIKLGNCAAGFSLVELMVALLIGLIILAGVISLHNTTRDTHRGSQDQLKMVTAARFAIETIGFDIRHAGSWGGTNLQQGVHCQKNYDNCSFGDDLPTATGDCSDRDYINLRRPIAGFNNSNPYAATCASNNYLADTDVLQVRYADPSFVVTTSLAGDTAYARTNVEGGKLFVGTSIPDHDHFKWEPYDQTNVVTKNYPLVSHVYYVSDYSYVPGDGIPALRRSFLVAGPEMRDELLISGVEDFQVQYGIVNNTVNPNDNTTVVSYVNADKVTTDEDWQKVSAIKLYVMVKADRRDISDVKDSTSISKGREYKYAGKTVNESDGYNRFLLSSVIRLRNTDRLGELGAAGSNN